jgi:hypothetical protein
VARDILPMIVVATGSIDISNSTNQKYFIFNEQTSNLPYSFYFPYAPEANKADATLSNNFYQGDFRNCDEIKAA